MMKLTAEMVEDPTSLDAVRDEWDALAVAESQPFAAPAWVMSWWRHLRPEGAVLRVVLVRSGDSLVGVVPLFSSGRRYLPLAHRLPGSEPLARNDLIDAVGEEAARALSRADPPPAAIELELRRSSPDWTSLLIAAWPGGRRPRRWVKSEEPLPRVELDAGYDAWMAERSSKFRGEARNKRNRIEKAGGIYRYSTSETLERDVAAFLALHRTRQAGQGGTNLTDDAIAGMLVAAGEDLLEGGRLRLLCLDLDGKTIAVRVLVRAGDELGMWNSGFDEAHSKLSPSVQTMLHAIADATGEEERLEVSLGPGGQSYKYRLSNAEDSLVTHVLLIPGRGYASARLRLGSERLRAELGRRAPEGLKRRLRRAVRVTRR
jgi:CelD/BcsL family acetyltransferase involved in cellulose biosynthesis